jgi:hypothetical protein
VRRLAAAAVVLGAIGASPGAAQERCVEAIDALAAELENMPEPKPAEAWQMAKDGRGETATQGSGNSGSSGPKESWMGASQGKSRAEELLFNARRMAEENKEEGCRQLVHEARRAVGLGRPE